ncbi:hypothetical protein VTL71DRAFT_14815 [Oculimacula yallundae]|uniref:Uncharacterized protein n=1 Tax=Oculimacula yallundae TaxID=86028 RepID=A0ABR4CK40_9HELO
MLLFPNVFWALCINGITLGANIAIGMTILTSLVALPVYGYGSDWIIKWCAHRRGGIYEPETRLLPLFIPVIIGIITPVLYGQGATHPENYHWFTYVWAFVAYFFTFIGANIVAITYLLDSYPQRASSLLIIICAYRGFLSFGVSFRLWDMVDAMGYDGAFNMFAGLTALMGVLGGTLFFIGKSIRNFTGRWVVVKDKDE